MYKVKTREKKQVIVKKNIEVTERYMGKKRESQALIKIERVSQRYGQTDRHRKTGETDRQTNIQTNKQANKNVNKQTDRLTVDKQTDYWTDRQNPISSYY